MKIKLTYKTISGNSFHGKFIYRDVYVPFKVALNYDCNRTLEVEAMTGDFVFGFTHQPFWFSLIAYPYNWIVEKTKMFKL